LAVEPIELLERRPVPRAGRIRRCSVRHVSILAVAGRGEVRVECQLGGAAHALPLGTMDDAREICSACTATTIWRADED